MTKNQMQFFESLSEDELQSALILIKRFKKHYMDKTNVPVPAYEMIENGYMELGILTTENGKPEE